MKRHVALAVLVLVAVVLGVLWWTRPAAVAAHDFERLVADLRARGEPTSLDEIPRHVCAPEDNGGPDLVAAVDWWEAHAPQGWRDTYVGPWCMRVTDPWWENASAEEMADLARFLDAMAPFYDRVDAASAKPCAEWPLAPQDESGLRDVPRWRHLQKLTRRLEARAYGDAREPGRRAACRDLLRVGSRPPLVGGVIDQLIYSSVATRACAALRCELLRDDRDVAALRSDLDVLLRQRWTDRLAGVANHERAFYCEVVPHVIDGSSLLAPGPYESIRDAWKAVLRGKNPFSGGAGAELVNTVAGLRALDRVVRLTPSWSRSYDDQVRACAPGPAPGRDLLLFLRVIEASRQADAVVRLARVALAAAAYREARGTWPVSASDLGSLLADGHVPIDPYTEGPFLLRSDGDDLILEAQPWSLCRPGQYASSAAREEAGLVWRLPPGR